MTPLARRLVKRHGLDPEKIEGTGANGRITRNDVLKALEQLEAEPEKETEAKAEEEKPEAQQAEQKQEAPKTAPAAEKPSVELGEEDEPVPLSSMRRRIAARLVHSKQTIPHVTTVVECDMTACAGARKKHKEEWESDGLKLSYMPFIMKATCDALQEFPAINSSWGGDKLIHHKRVHLAIAIAVEGGLAVPVIRNADGMSMRELAKALTTVADHARKGKLTSEEVSGSTFTITNPGIFGAVFSTPIINPPNAAILGTGRIAETPVVLDGEIVARMMMYLCLSYDHRIVDGETAIKFLGHMGDALEKAEFDMG